MLRPRSIIWTHDSKIYQGLRTGVDELLVVAVVFVKTYLTETEGELAEVGGMDSVWAPERIVR